MNLRDRLTLTFLALSMISMAVIATVAFSTGRQQILDHTFDRLEVSNHLTGAEYNRWVMNAQRTLEAIAQRPLVVELSQDIAQADAPEKEAYVDRLLAVHFVPRLQEVEFERLYLMDPANGQILVSTDPNDLGKFREDQQYFLGGLLTTTVQSVYYSMSEQEPRLTVGTPVSAPNGAVVGVLAGDLNLEEMSRIFSTALDSRESEESYLVNGQGLAISQLLFEEDAILQTWVRSEGVQRCLAGESVQGIFYDYRGISVLGVYDWLPEYQHCLVTEIDEAEALAPIREYRTSVIGYGMLIALFVSAVGFFYSNRLAQPVKQMRDVARQFGHGDLDQRMEIPATEEYAELAEEFNRMAAELQADLESLEMRYRSLFETVPVGLYQSTRKGKFREANSALLRILGFEKLSDLLATPTPFLYANPNDREMWLQRLDQEGVVSDFEVQIRRPDGRKIWLRHDAHLSTTPQGEEIIEGAVADVTERYRIAMELRASEARFRTVVQTSQDIITLLDAEGNYLYASPAMKAVLGRDPSELLGQNAFQFIHPQDLARVQQKFSSLLEHPMEEITARFRFMHADGHWLHLEALGANHLTNPDLEGLVITSRDISSRVEAEQMLQAYADDLKRSNEELEQFAYVASHDLQEPLRMVASYVQLLQKRLGDQLDADTQEFIHYAVDGAQRMQQLINDLLQFSRVGTRGKELLPVSSQQIVEDAIHSLGARINETGGEVIIENELPMVQADAGQVRQVFQNLISNGLKFHGDAAPKVSIRARQNGSSVEFEIEDNGIGIDPKYADRIFVIFQRLHTRQEYEGTGIGLAISKKIVERHGGTIWFESSQGSGTSFFFTLSSVEKG